VIYVALNLLTLLPFMVMYVELSVFEPFKNIFAFQNKFIFRNWPSIKRYYQIN